ncbi:MULTISPECIES: TonB-dependent receptor domain-containing protein [Acinetobacter]|uniref:TonB-dependent receptor domain-containing protein n=1 Tax=Acinetobacter TaxID=469 RepID=UPI000CEC2A73|nr:MULTISPECIES: TonB-dependent receptor [Acinetobacter]MDM1280504.1 TonB-dependent receptor [Acinetobacter indicus]MDM1329798.1 TonB-dependent receptor [Acinetobacter indicus]MDM1338268.1 TonB-dependent receptor [Acinetobacter indicus]QSG83820.1 TonB-dependent receptor [Acinetobacter indicus]
MNKTLNQSALSFAVLAVMSSLAQANPDNSTADATQLNTIVVTATGYEQDLSKAPASITVIDREELEKREYNDITDVLRHTPGVVVSGSGSAQTISIRGMSSNYTLFLVDGKRQYGRDVNPNGDDAGFEKNILPPVSAIERIEIIRGPASTLYGTDAMGGVVNIITKKVSDRWSGSVELGSVIQDQGNAGDIQNGSVYLAGPLLENKLGLQLSLNKQKREEDAYVGGFRGTERESLNSRLSYILNDNHDLQLEANFVQQESETTVGKTVAPANNAADSSSRNYRHVYALTHHGRYSDQLDSTTYLQYENSKNPDRGNTQLGTKGIELDTWTFNNQWNWLLGNHTLSFGAHYKDEKLTDKATNRNPNAPEFSELTRWSAAAFLEDTWHLSDRFDLTAGLRYDHDENYSGHVSPRLYGVYSLNDQWTVKGGVSTGYKQPDIRAATEGFYSVTGGGGSPLATGRGIIRANPDLDPESSLSSELGVNWQNDRVKASLTAYVTQYKDRITEVRACETDTDGSSTNRDNWQEWKCFEGDTPFYFISERINVDEAELKGVEATLEASLSDYTTLMANYTFTDSEFKTGEFKGQPVNQMPEHMLNITVDHEINDALNVWSRLHYRSETSAYLSRTSVAQPNPGYEFLDVGLNYKFTPNISGKFGVYNLLDEKAEDRDGDQLLDGRRYGISLMARF